MKVSTVEMNINLFRTAQKYEHLETETAQIKNFRYKCLSFLVCFFPHFLYFISQELYGWHW